MYRRALMLTLLLVGWTSTGRAERIPLGVSPEKQGFEKIAHRRGVTVYKHKHSDIIKLAADSRFKASVDEVRRALINYEGQVGLINRLSETRVLKRKKKSLLVYQRLNLPVISDRDFYLKVHWWREGQTTWIAYKAIRAGRPVRDGVVRVTRHVGSWQLRPIKGGRETQARFQVAIDMAGWLPKWMARSGSGKEVPELFVSINQLINRSRLRSEKCTPKCL